MMTTCNGDEKKSFNPASGCHPLIWWTQEKFVCLHQKVFFTDSTMMHHGGACEKHFSKKETQKLINKNDNNNNNSVIAVLFDPINKSTRKMLTVSIIGSHKSRLSMRNMPQVVSNFTCGGFSHLPCCLCQCLQYCLTVPNQKPSLWRKMVESGNSIRRINELDQSQKTPSSRTEFWRSGIHMFKGTQLE